MIHSDRTPNLRNTTGFVDRRKMINFPDRETRGQQVRQPFLHFCDEFRVAPEDVNSVEIQTRKVLLREWQASDTACVNVERPPLAQRLGLDLIDENILTRTPSAFVVGPRGGVEHDGESAIAFTACRRAQHDVRRRSRSIKSMKRKRT